MREGRGEEREEKPRAPLSPSVSSLPNTAGSHAGRPLVEDSSPDPQ